jgi:hypothetical protein
MTSANCCGPTPARRPESEWVVEGLDDLLRLAALLGGRRARRHTTICKGMNRFDASHVTEGA